MKLIPCFRRLAAAFAGSHVKRKLISESSVSTVARTSG
jgi:hypothetical protein